MKFAKFLRTCILKRICERLLLLLVTFWISKVDSVIIVTVLLTIMTSKQRKLSFWSAITNHYAITFWHEIIGMKSLTFWHEISDTFILLPFPFDWNSMIVSWIKGLVYLVAFCQWLKNLFLAMDLNLGLFSGISAIHLTKFTTWVGYLPWVRSQQNNVFCFLKANRLYENGFITSMWDLTLTQVRSH